jgi:hypothetical protein
VRTPVRASVDLAATRLASRAIPGGDADSTERVRLESAPGALDGGAALPTVSAIVPTYNRRDKLPMVVDALLADPATTEVVVVVDGCRDGSLDVLRERAATEPRLKPVFIENRGTAGAQQAGVEHASGDVVLLLADDVIAAPGMVTGHAHRHAGRERLVVVGYMPISDWRSRPRDRFASYLYACEYERACQVYDRASENTLRALWGGNVSLRRTDCLRVGVGSDRFGENYHEDTDFGLRCLKAGLTGVFDRSLLAEHAHERTLDGVLRDARKQGAGKALLHEVHSDVLGPLDTGLFEASLPRPARWLVRLARRPRARGLIVALLGRMVRAAEVLRLFWVEVRVVQLLRRVEMQAGALATMRRSPAVGADRLPGR